MAKTASNKVGWAKSSATDVVAYRMRMKKAPAVIDYPDPFFELPATADSYDFGTDPAFIGMDDSFNLALTSVDDSGNESDMTRLDNFPLDLVPPDAPTQFRRL